MNQQWIDQWIGTTRKQMQLVEALSSGLSSKEIHWKPSETGWSITQVLDHLNQTSQEYAPGVDRLLAQGNRANPSTKPYRAGWIASKAIRFIGPEGTRKMKSPKRFRPAPEPQTDGVADFMKWQEWWVNRMGSARLLNLNSPKMGSPELALFRLSLGECFEMICGHTQRHLNQALRVRQSDEFPGDSLAMCGPEEKE